MEIIRLFCSRRLRKGWERHPLLPTKISLFENWFSSSKDIVDDPTRATCYFYFKKGLCGDGLRPNKHDNSNENLGDESIKSTCTFLESPYKKLKKCLLHQHNNI